MSEAADTPDWTQESHDMLRDCLDMMDEYRLPKAAVWSELARKSARAQGCLVADSEEEHECDAGTAGE